MYTRIDSLFSSTELSTLVQERAQAMLTEIDQRPGSIFLQNDTDEYCAALVQRYRIEPIVLDEAGVTAEQDEVTIDARRDPYSAVHGFGGQSGVLATRISFYVPFAGNAHLFQCQPSTFTHSPPVGRVEGKDLILEYTRRDHNAEAVKASFSADIAKVKQYVAWIANDLAAVPARLDREARVRIAVRRDKAEKDKAMLNDLGFPRRNDRG